MLSFYDWFRESTKPKIGTLYCEIKIARQMISSTNVKLEANQWSSRLQSFQGKVAVLHYK